MTFTLLILTTLSHLGLYLWGRGDGIRVERGRRSPLPKPIRREVSVTEFVGSASGREMTRITDGDDSYVSLEGIVWYSEPGMSRCDWHTNRWLERICNENEARREVTP
jgi:hypothetical protein